MTDDRLVTVTVYSGETKEENPGIEFIAHLQVICDKSEYLRGLFRGILAEGRSLSSDIFE